MLSQTKSGNLDQHPEGRNVLGSPGDQGATDRVLTLLVDLGIALIIFVAPLFMGGRHPLGKLVFVSLVSLTGTLWCVRAMLGRVRRWRWTGVEVLLLLVLGVGFIQLIPLPPSMLQLVSPATAKLLPLWFSPNDSPCDLGPWRHLSLHPSATREALAVCWSYVLLFLVLAQRIETLEDIERLMRWLAIAAIAMAALGIAQLLFGNGKFLWIYANPQRTTHGAVRGPFFNENHFAQFLALGTGPLIWWFWQTIRAPASWSCGTPRPLALTHAVQQRNIAQLALGMGLGLVAFAGLLTFSRGGIIVLVLAAAICVAVHWRTEQLKVKSLMGIVSIMLLVACALSVYGYDAVAGQLQTISQAHSVPDLFRDRWTLWKAMLAAARDFPLIGTGVGSHRVIYPRYLAQHFDVDFTYGESGYLQLLLETGLVGLGLALAAIAVAFSWCLRVFRQTSHPRCRAAAGALLAGMAASVCHSVADFVWYIPACMALTLVLAACACRLHQLAPRQESSPVADGAPASGDFSPEDGSTGRHSWQGTCSVPRLLWVPATAAMCLLSVAVIDERLPAAGAARHWDRFSKSVAAAGKLAKDRQVVNHLIGDLEQLLQENPHDARAHLYLAQLYLRRFEIAQQNSANPMPLDQIRGAAVASHFRSPLELHSWLTRALGRNLALLERAGKHANEAARLCPLLGEAYLYLSELVFLKGDTGPGQRLLLQQALLARPHSAAVLTVAGREAALAGDFDTAMRYWRDVFHNHPLYRKRIIEMLAPRTTAAFFVDQFRPGRVALGQLYQFYMRINRTDEARQIAPRYAELLQRDANCSGGPESASLWYAACRVYRFLNQPQAALACIQNAVGQAPNDFALHRLLAQQLLETQEFDAAIEQLKWCLRRRPNDQNLQSLLLTARKRSLTTKVFVRDDRFLQRHSGRDAESPPSGRHREATPVAKARWSGTERKQR